MNNDQLRTTVLQCLREIAPEVTADELEPDVALQEQIDLDSVDFLNFMIALGERTGIEIPERDYREVATLNGCVAYLATHGAPVA
jgi:acyl carrier protein